MKRAVCLAMLAVSVTAHADEMASSAARPDYDADVNLWMPDSRRRMEAAGLVIDVTYTVDMFLAPQLDKRFVAGGLFTLEVDVFDRAHIQAFAIHGDGVTAELMDLHGVSGNTAEPDVRLFEAWIDQPIGPLTLRAGLLGVDQEFVLADRSSLLLSATFGITSQFSANVLGPVYPIAAPALSGRLELDDVTTRLAIYEGTLENTHGIPTQLGPAALVIGEAMIVDTFKVGGWHHTELGNAGYAIIDAQLVPSLGAFARAGYSPDGRVTTYIDAGVRATPPWRSEDLMSMGIAFAHAEQGAETVLEACYELQVKWLSVQPDAQLVFMHDRTVGVFTTRLTVAL